MNSFCKAVAATALGFLISQMCGCASSNLVNKWHDPSFQGPPLSKMLVIAARKNAVKRRIWEDAFVSEFQKHGVTATTSYSLFPDAPPDTNQIEATVQAKEFNGILVILKLPAEINKRYIQGYISTEQHVRYGFYWHRYLTYYYEIEHPGYIGTQIVDIHTIDVSTTGNNGRLIWSATSRTPDPGFVTDIQHEIAGLVISELAQRSIISPKK